MKSTRNIRHEQNRRDDVVIIYDAVTSEYLGTIYPYSDIPKGYTLVTHGLDDEFVELSRNDDSLLPVWMFSKDFELYFDMTDAENKYFATSADAIHYLKLRSCGCEGG